MPDALTQPARDARKAGAATTLADPRSAASESQDFRGSPGAISGTRHRPEWAKERQREAARKKAVEAALDHFKSEMPGTFKGRAWAIEKIKAHQRPLKEAKRLVAWLRTKNLTGTVDEDRIEYADVQELRVRLIRRDGILDQPRAMLLVRMDRMIAQDQMDRATFNVMASAVLGMKPALSEAFRKAESEAR